MPPDPAAPGPPARGQPPCPARTRSVPGCNAPARRRSALRLLTLLLCPQQRRAAACFSLRASEACQGWSSLALLEENATQRFSYNPDPASFDSAIRSIVGSVRDVEEFRRFWSCPAYDGSSQRYRLSFLCAEIVLAANNTRSCNSPPSSPLMPSGATSSPQPSLGFGDMALCRTTCLQFVESLQRILSNRAWCPGRVPQSERRLGLYRALCDTFPFNGNAGACVSGETNEPDTCGYTFVKDRCNFNCAGPDPQILCGADHQTAAASLPPPLPSATPAPTALSPPALDSSDGRMVIQLTIPLVLGLGTSVIMIAAAAAVCCFYMAKRRYQVTSVKQPPSMPADVPYNAAGGRDRKATIGGVMEQGDEYRAVLSFDGRKEDELDLRRGDLVTVSHTHTDGWVTGRSRVTGREGVFPLACVEPVDGQKRVPSSLLRRMSKPLRGGMIPKRTTSHIRRESRDRWEEEDEYFSEVYPIDVLAGRGREDFDNSDSGQDLDNLDESGETSIYSSGMSETMPLDGEGARNRMVAGLPGEIEANGRATVAQPGAPSESAYSGFARERAANAMLRSTSILDVSGTGVEPFSTQPNNASPGSLIVDGPAHLESVVLPSDLARAPLGHPPPTPENLPGAFASPVARPEGHTAAPFAVFLPRDLQVRVESLASEEVVSPSAEEAGHDMQPATSAAQQPAARGGLHAPTASPMNHQEQQRSWKGSISSSTFCFSPISATFPPMGPGAMLLPSASSPNLSTFPGDVYQFPPLPVPLETSNAFGSSSSATLAADGRSQFPSASGVMTTGGIRRPSAPSPLFMAPAMISPIAVSPRPFYVGPGTNSPVPLSPQQPSSADLVLGSFPDLSPVAGARRTFHLETSKALLPLSVPEARSPSAVPASPTPRPPAPAGHRRSMPESAADRVVGKRPPRRSETPAAPSGRRMAFAAAAANRRRRYHRAERRGGVKGGGEAETRRLERHMSRYEVNVINVVTVPKTNLRVVNK